MEQEKIQRRLLHQPEQNDGCYRCSQQMRSTWSVLNNAAAHPTKAYGLDQANWATAQRRNQLSPI